MWCGWLIRKRGEILQLNTDGTFSELRPAVLFGV